MNVAAQASESSWSLGVLVGGPLLFLALVALVVGGILLVRFDGRLDSRHHDKGVPKWFGLGLLALAGVVLIGVLSPMGYYPYSAEYHQWREVSGTVAKIDSRVISTGEGSMETKFVARFEGDGQQYGCDDTRCAGVVVGDQLTLSCKRAWQYTGIDGYDYRFVGTEAAS